MSYWPLANWSEENPHGHTRPPAHVSYNRNDRKNNLLLLVELHDLLDRRRRRAVDQVVVVLDRGPGRRQ